jgi:hypothetical protein
MRSINLNLMPDQMTAPDRALLKNLSVTRTLSIKLSLREQDLHAQGKGMASQIVKLKDRVFRYRKPQAMS